MNLQKITNPVIDGIDTNDYPDFSDAYIVSGEYEGNELTPDEIDEINENWPEYVQGLALLEVCGG